MLIEDAKGRGQSASVTDNRLDVSSRTNTRASYNSRDKQETYSWSAAYDYTGGDTILLVCNNSTTKKLYIENVSVGSDTATRFTVFSPAYPTLAGTGVTGVNSNRTSGNAADASAYQNETGNSQANILRQGMLAANSEILFHIDGRIVLGYHQSIAVDFVTSGTMATCTIIGYFE